MSAYLLNAGGACSADTCICNRYEKEFENVQDVFELQRNLNNAFAYDLVPSPSVITAALRAARRVNDYPTAVRIFEGMFQKFASQGERSTLISFLRRHQGKGRAQGPVRRVPARAGGRAGRAWREPQGELVPGELVIAESVILEDWGKSVYNEYKVLRRGESGVYC